MPWRVHDCYEVGVLTLQYRDSWAFAQLDAKVIRVRSSLLGKGRNLTNR